MHKAISSSILPPTFTTQLSEPIEFEDKDEQSEQLKTPPITKDHQWQCRDSMPLQRASLSSSAITRLLCQSSPGAVSPITKRLMTKRWEHIAVSQPAAPALQHTTEVAVETAISLGDIGEAAVQGEIVAVQIVAVQGDQQAPGRMRSAWRRSAVCEQPAY